MNARRIITGMAALLIGAVIAGCSASSSAPPASHSQPSSATLKQWWSGTDYCSILRQTVQAGQSALVNATADDPALLATTKSFVSDLIAAAPGPVRAQWQVLGPALTDLVSSGGKLHPVSGANSRRVAAAAAAIAADAKSRCHVDVST